jgi:hypothetical protein
MRRCSRPEGLRLGKKLVECRSWGQQLLAAGGAWHGCRLACCVLYTEEKPLVCEHALLHEAVHILWLGKACTEAANVDFLLLDQRWRRRAAQLLVLGPPFMRSLAGRTPAKAALRDPKIAQVSCDTTR